MITGSSPGEEPAFGAAGDIRAWDMRSGKLVWTFHTLPRPGEPNHEVWQDGQWESRAGVNSWSFITVDVKRGMAFVPIGTPNTDFYGGDRKGSNLYGSTLVALDAATGKLKWYFQTTHHDNWDYDLASAPYRARCHASLRAEAWNGGNMKGKLRTQAAYSQIFASGDGGARIFVLSYPKRCPQDVMAKGP